MAIEQKERKQDDTSAALGMDNAKGGDVNYASLMPELDGLNLAQYIYDNGVGGEEMTMLNEEGSAANNTRDTSVDKASDALAQLGLTSETFANLDLSTQIQLQAALKAQAQLQQEQQQQGKGKMQQPLHNLPTPMGSELYQMNDNAFMSPLDMPSDMPPSGGFNTDGYEDDDLLFTPLMSPAVTPGQPFSQAQMLQDHFTNTAYAEQFSPLSSPALNPTADQQSKVTPLALGKSSSRKKRGSVEVPPRTSRTRPSPLLKAQNTRRKKSLASAANPLDNLQEIVNKIDSAKQKSSSPQGDAAASAAMPPPPIPISGSKSASSSPAFAPVTPASIMNMPSRRRQSGSIPPSPVSSLKSPHLIPALKSPQLHPTPSINPAVLSPNLPPTAGHSRSSSVAASSPTNAISPSLKPILPGQMSADAVARLANKSNYQNILDGDSQSLGLTYASDIQSGIASRRSSHKAAEQKRRDSLKQCFDDLRRLLPEEIERGASKVVLLKKSHDYIMRLHEAMSSRDDAITRLRSQVRELKAKAGEPYEEEEEDVKPRITKATATAPRSRSAPRRKAAAEAAAAVEAEANDDMDIDSDDDE